MNLFSKRMQYRPDGIFSQIFIDEFERQPLFVTLEHAYPSGQPASWLPKITPGHHVCVRGMHLLHGMTEAFETFEVTGIDGHTGLLWHWGNVNANSDGCILTGERVADIVQDPNSVYLPDELITNSRDAFARFMTMQQGLDTFLLTVRA